MEKIALAKSDLAKTGLITGCFDLLHVGHRHFWERAQQSCQQLIIGVESDARVRAMKGKTRPIYPALIRCQRLLNCCPSAKVLILPENFFLQNVRRKFLQDHQIDVLFIGAQDQFLDNKRALIQELGGKVEIIPLKQKVSTTAILQGQVSPNNLLFAEDRQCLK